MTKGWGTDPHPFLRLIRDFKWCMKLCHEKVKTIVSDCTNKVYIDLQPGSSKMKLNYV